MEEEKQSFFRMVLAAWKRKYKRMDGFCTWTGGVAYLKLL
jgi:hypothetical protein